MIVKVALIMLFFGSVAHSYQEYEERREPIERFSFALDFMDVLKNHLLCLKVRGIPSPCLIDESALAGFDYYDLSRYWNRPYQWEVVIKDASGQVIYEEGNLARRGMDTLSMKARREYTVAYSIVAIHSEDGKNMPGRLEVWVWST